MEMSDLKLIYILIIIIIAAYITLHIYRFYSQLALYPHGPKPLPFIGNLHLLIVNSCRHPSFLFKELAQTYGEMFTFWMGLKPVVVINEFDAAKQAFNQNECSGRLEPHIASKLMETVFGNYNAFALMNYSDEIKVLRKVSVEALRKLLSSNAMCEITHKIVDNTVMEMKARESGKPFVPFKYIDTIFIRILFEATFNRPLDFENHKIDEIRQHFESININILKVIFRENIPLLKVFLNTTEMRNSGKRFLGVIIKRFNKNKKLSVVTTDDNHHCLLDSHMLAANNMRHDLNSDEQYLSDSNIIGNLANLFVAASDTSHYTFKWILLLMAYYPEMQRKMRDEIRNNVGNKIPDKSDREKCHFVNAFICESLRFRFIFFGSIHMTSRDTKIVNTLIPCGTMVISNQFAILNDKNYWQNPDIFTPERFLDSENHLIATKIAAFIPFSIGKRMCVGDKFAKNMLFLVLTRLLQTTDGMKFELQDRQNTDLEPKPFGFFIEPKPYKLRLIKQNN